MEQIPDVTTCCLRGYFFFFFAFTFFLLLLLSTAWTLKPHFISSHYTETAHMLAKSLQSCPTVCDLWSVEHQAPPSMRFSRQEYWSFSFSIMPSKEHPGLISFRMDWLNLLAAQGLSRVFSNTTAQKHQFFSAQLSSQSNSHIHT